jgi:hypothetical protein
LNSILLYGRLSASGRQRQIEVRRLLPRQVFAEYMILRVAQRFVVRPQAVGFGGRRRGA